MKRIKLKNPIEAHGKELKEIIMKPPTTKQLIKIGAVAVLLPDESTMYRNSVVAVYISKLAAIPMSSVEELSIADFTACKLELVAFLGAAAI